MREFLNGKRTYDPKTLFTSDWYEHHVRLLSHEPLDYQRACAS
jgi:hypothetical protein